jgi:hypothetical protein
MTWADAFTLAAWERALPPLLVVSAIVSGIILVVRTLVTSAVERAVHRRSEQSLETFRAELRRSEEIWKGELRVAEAETAALRDSILSGRGQRQALLDKRRIEAVERLWGYVGELAPFRALAMTLAVFKLAEAAKLASTDPRIQKMMDDLTKSMAPEKLGQTGNASNERPFLSPLAWAYFSAYVTVIAFYFAYGKLIAVGLEGGDRLIDEDNLRKTLVAALPAYREFIEEGDSHSYVNLLEILENSLLAELRRSLEDTTVDEQRLQQAQVIMAAVKEGAEQAERARGLAIAGASTAAS